MSTPSDSPLALRQALGCFATGVTIVTTRLPDGQPLGVTVNSFSALSLDPPLVLWSLRAHSTSLAAFREAGWFAVNVLAQPQQALSLHFARSEQGPGRFQDVDWQPGLEGLPLFDGCLASFECQTVHNAAHGDHELFIGEVRRFTQPTAAVGAEPPLLFYRGGFRHAAEMDAPAGA